MDPSSTWSRILNPSPIRDGEANARQPAHPAGLRYPKSVKKLDDLSIGSTSLQPRANHDNFDRASFNQPYIQYLEGEWTEEDSHSIEEPSVEHEDESDFEEDTEEIPDDEDASEQ